MIFRKNWRNTKVILRRLAEASETENGYKVNVYLKKDDHGYKENCKGLFLSIEYTPQGKISGMYLWLPSPVEEIDDDLKKGGHIDTFEKLVDHYGSFNDTEIFQDKEDERETICRLNYQNQIIGVRLEEGKHPYKTFEEYKHLFPEYFQKDVEKTIKRIGKKTKFFKKHRKAISSEHL